MNKLLPVTLIFAALAGLLPVTPRAVAAAEVQAVTYEGMAAFRISDGRTEAVVVPQIGRIMRYGKVGGANVLWNAAKQDWKPGDWKNYGGEKNWLAPQSSWAEFHGNDFWPPDPVLDGSPYEAKTTAPGVLEMHSQVSPGTGIRIGLMLSFAADGDLVLHLSASKSIGHEVRAGLWSNTQVVPGAAVFLPVSPNSAYKQGYLRMMQHGTATESEPDMIRVDPGINKGTKFGVDAGVAAIVSVADGVAFLDSTELLPGTYPDGPETAGLPVELYVGGDAANLYCELELLGPLAHARAGASWSMTLHWSLHDLPAGDAGSPQVAAAARRLLYGSRKAASLVTPSVAP